MTIVIVGAFHTLLVMTNAVTVVIGVAEIGFHLFAAWARSDGDDFRFYRAQWSELSGEIDPAIGEIFH